jgi:hypothetical protein
MQCGPSAGVPAFAGLIRRLVLADLESRLVRFPALALPGPRQAGKTTLALQLAARRPSLYLDLESPADPVRLSDPVLSLGSQVGPGPIL